MTIAACRIDRADLGSAADRAAWDEYVRTAPGAANYHRSGWMSVVEEVFGHAAYALWARGADGGVRGVLPLAHVHSHLFGSFLVSLPFFNYGGVLADDAVAAEALLDAAEELRERIGAAHVELRHKGTALDGLPTKTHKVTMLLELPEDPEILWKGFKAKVRNQVRKAEKSGLTFVSGREELLDGFYDVFSRNMRDLGTPVYAKRLFAAVLDRFPDSTRLFAVRLGEKYVAGGFGAWFNGVFEIPWASSIRDYNSLCPNNLMYWGMLRRACVHGCSVFDFGRSTPDKGTFHFKKQWGARPVQLYWQYLLAEGGELPSINPDNPKYGLAIRVWKHLPLPLTRLIGPHIVRCIP